MITDVGLRMTEKRQTWRRHGVHRGVAVPALHARHQDRSDVMTHQYRCDDCDVDCTAGTPAGPPTTGTDRRTRCWECQRSWEQLRGATSPWTKDECKAIEVALSQIADDGDPMPITPAMRKTATAILSRIERRRE